MVLSEARQTGLRSARSQLDPAGAGAREAMATRGGTEMRPAPPPQLGSASAWNSQGTLKARHQAASQTQSPAAGIAQAAPGPLPGVPRMTV